MTDIPNTEYITVNKDGVFVGSKPATTFNGRKICHLDCLKADFAETQKQNSEIQELHVGAFLTKGTFFAESGKPSGTLGASAWCRVKLYDGRLGPWVFSYTYGAASECASYCACGCGFNVRFRSDMRSAVLNFANKKEQQDKITIEKIIQNVK